MSENKTIDPILHNASISAEEISKRLCAFLQENILAPQIEVSPNTELNMLGVDSFSLMEMILFIERCYGLVLPPESLTPDNIASVASLSQYCALQLSAADV
jgi:acyl carrier protein